MPGGPETGEGHSEASVENDRKDDCSSASSPPSPISLQSSPIFEELCILSLPVVRKPGSPQPRSPEGSAMVDQEVRHWNGRCLKATPPELPIETSASLLGWGASLDLCTLHIFPVKWEVIGLRADSYWVYVPREVIGLHADNHLVYCTLCRISVK